MFLRMVVRVNMNPGVINSHIWQNHMVGSMPKTIFLKRNQRHLMLPKAQAVAVTFGKLDAKKGGITELKVFR